MNSSVISKQTFVALKQKFKFFGRGEINELEHILVPGETILEVLNGFYSGGFAVLCATNMRLLLIDKKPFLLNVEDVRYDSINEIDYRARIIDATAVIHTPSKQMQFTSWRQRDLRSLVTFVQRHIMQLRQQAAEQATAMNPAFVSSVMQPAEHEQPTMPQQTAATQPANAVGSAYTTRQPAVARVESNSFDEGSVRRLAFILRRPRIGKFLLSQ